MKKLNKGTSDGTTIFLGIVVVLLIGFIVMWNNSKSVVVTQQIVENVKSSSDLDVAQDQLNAVNTDSVDTGVTQLTTEVASF